ncbi:MAG: protein TolA [Gammaproteobacteria bacterium]|nr:protein TolA [Gammaproteobacteria bacterium]
MVWIRNYSLPLVLALLVHLAAAAMLLQGWTPAPKIADVIKPQVVNASLIVMQAPAKPAAPAPKPKPKPAAVTAKAKKTPKPSATKQPSAAEKAKAAAARKKAAEAQAAERRRLQLAALGDMADAALEQSLERESVSLLRDEEAQIAQSYRAEIYELVRQNWSRPPSARNGMSARLLVELIPTGEVISVAVVEGSGNAAFDQAAEQAVRQARRFPVPDNNSQFERYFRRFYFLFQPEDLLR